MINDIKELDTTDEIKQYYVPMGFKVAIEMTASLPSAIYISELRSGKTVHPTLRPVAQKIGEVIKTLVPYSTSYCDNGPDEFSTKRGVQDIVEKK